MLGQIGIPETPPIVEFHRLEHGFHFIWIGIELFETILQALAARLIKGFPGEEFVVVRLIFLFGLRVRFAQPIAQFRVVHALCRIGKFIVRDAEKIEYYFVQSRVLAIKMFSNSICPVRPRFIGQTSKRDNAEHRSIGRSARRLFRQVHGLPFYFELFWVISAKSC